MADADFSGTMYVMREGTYVSDPYGFQRRADGWPPPNYTIIGPDVHRMQAMPGLVRHDLTVEHSKCGKIIGKGGDNHRKLQQLTGGRVFLIDKEPIPNEASNLRLCILIGTPTSVTKLMTELTALMAQTGPPQANPAIVQTDPTYHNTGPATYVTDHYGFKRRTDWWPPASFRPVGAEVASLQATPGLVRHDIMIHMSKCGKIIGKGGETFKRLENTSGARVFLIDREPAPGEDPNNRLVVLIGPPDNVSQLASEVLTPPPPPLPHPPPPLPPPARSTPLERPRLPLHCLPPLCPLPP